ncbi:MAG: ABC transporter permease [Chloroflexi bacterium]|nr:ABC transporter permease [Chloroflexota bacterium]
MNVLRIAVLTWDETRRARALVAGIALTAIFLGFFSWGVSAAASQFGQARPSPLMLLASQSNIDFASIIWGQVLSAGLYGVAGIGALLAIFLGAPSIAREVETGTLQLLASRPIGRWEIVTGKWLGGCALLVAYVGGSGALACASVWHLTGYAPGNPVLVVGALSIQVVVLHSLTIATSSVLPTITAGIVPVILHGIAGVAGFGERIGTLLESAILKKTGIIASLILPSDVAWQLAASQAQPPNPLPALGFNAPMGPFDVISAPSPWIAAYALAYALACLAFAIWRVNQKDL